MQITHGETRHVTLTDSELRTAINNFVAGQFNNAGVKNLIGFKLTGVKRIESPKYREHEFKEDPVKYLGEPITEFRFTSVVKGR